MDADEAHSTAAPHPPSGRPRAFGMFGDDLSRVIALSDGVFAFALTLLALSLTVPVFSTAGQSSGQVSSHLAFLLQRDYNAFFGYVFAFVMIAVWWIGHHRAFDHIARYTSGLVWINMAFLIQIAVMPFVLSVFNDYSDTQVAVALFAGLQMSLGITISLLWDFARRWHLLKPKVSEAVVQYLSRRNLFSAGVFAVSIGITFVSLTAAEVSWVFVFVLQRLLDLRTPAPVV
ncbi:MAG TPA: TMEM175 family protein [Thermoplasmata archaeon]|nr:TMEM175 family protein [Thermoplasmata archaeon]